MMIIISVYPRVGVSAVWLRWLTVLVTLLPVSISSRWFRKSLNPRFLRSHKSRTNDWCSARLLRIISMTTALCVCVCVFLLYVFGHNFIQKYTGVCWIRIRRTQSRFFFSFFNWRCNEYHHNIVRILTNIQWFLAFVGSTVTQVQPEP